MQAFSVTMKPARFEPGTFHLEAVHAYSRATDAFCLRNIIYLNRTVIYKHVEDIYIFIYLFWRYQVVQGNIGL